MYAATRSEDAVKSYTTERFRRGFQELPERVQRSARRAYMRFRRDPSHPSLQFKKVHEARPVYSVRVSLGYHAVGAWEGVENLLQAFYVLARAADDLKKGTPKRPPRVDAG